MQHPFAAYFLSVAACAVLACASLPAHSEDPADAKPLALRQIMQDMDRDMQAIVEAVSREDWEKAAKAATAIADHPQPPIGERVQILAFVGADAGRFRGHDESSKKAAKALQAAAARADGQAVIASFAVLQGSCLGCHQGFRRPLLDHFYGKR